MGTNKKNRKRAIKSNNESYYFWYNFLKLCCMSRFKYDNVPDSWDINTLERALFERGKCCCFDGSDEGITLTLPYANLKNFDCYGFPLKIKPYSPYTGTVNYPPIDYKNFEICFNNINREPDFYICKYFAQKISDIWRTDDVNLFQQKQALGVLVGDETQRNSVQEALTNLSLNMTYIILDSNNWGKKVKNKGNTLEPFANAVPFIGDKLTMQIHAIFNMFLNAIGVENSNQDKKERVNSSETNGNIGVIELTRNSYLNQRKEFVERCNKKFGYNIEVSFNSNVKTLLNEAFGINLLDEQNVSRETLEEGEEIDKS